jgi:hypothetical protein
MNLKNRSTAGATVYVKRVFHSYVYSKDCSYSFTKAVTIHVNISIFAELGTNIMQLDPTLSWYVLISCIEHFQHGGSASL